MSAATILTRHPQGKTGRNITTEKYNLIKDTFLDVLQNRPLTHNELMTEMNARLTGKFDGSINWYSETVKLDLEAKQIIERTADKPQKYMLK